jgi:hypothetical protein
MEKENNRFGEGGGSLFIGEGGRASNKAGVFLP